VAEYKYLKPPKTPEENLVVAVYPKFLRTTLNRAEIRQFIQAFQLEKAEIANEIPYDLMTAIIFQSNYEYDGGILNNNIEVISLSTEKDAGHCLNKILNHTVLAFTQRNEFAGVLKKARQDTAQLSKDIKAQKDEIATQKVDVEALTQRTKRISIEFTTVLGIFTSIVFALFGGVQVVSGLLGSKNALTAHDIGNAILLASIATTLVYLLLIALLSGIGKLTENHYEVSGKVTAIVFLTLLLLGLVGLLYGHVTASGKLIAFLQAHSIIVPSVLILVIVVVVALIGLVLMSRARPQKIKEQGSNH
jgi:hypothetical protein